MIRSVPVSRRSLLTLFGSGAGAAALGATAACGDDPTSGRTPFDIWVPGQGNENDAERAAVDRFNAGSAAKATLLAQTGDGYRDKVDAAMGDGQRPGMFFNWGGDSIRSYIRRGLLEDLTPHLDGAPAWKSGFLGPVLDAGKIDGKYYGIPLSGMQPIILFYHTKIFRENGLRPPTTWTELLTLVDRFKAVDITPIALAGGVDWAELMWIEYLTDRIGGRTVFEDIAAGKPGAWQHPAIARSIDMLRDLVERGGFGTSFRSVRTVTGGASSLLAKGRAAMHLMGSWEYKNQLRDEPEFARSELGYTLFPTIDGGVGDTRAVVGNPTNYFSVTKGRHVPAAISFLKQEMTSDSYVGDWLKRGEIPAVTGIEARLRDAADPNFAKLIFTMVKEAPSFQLSWDQAIERNRSMPMLQALAKVFLGQLDAKGFVAANEAVK